MGGCEESWPAAGEDVDARVVHAQACEDYRRLLEFDIRTVRENASWARIDRAGRYDHRAISVRALAAADAGMQVAWTLFSRPWPEDLDLLSAAFVDRFARYAGLTSRVVADLNPVAVPVFTPVNEMSYLAWALWQSGLVRRGDGSRADVAEIKRQLARAAIAACDAILAAVPHARLLHSDPLIHIVAPRDRPELAGEAARRCALQFEGWDLLAGRSGRELGGRERYLDLVGVNYYADNQWELGSGKRLAWQFDDQRRQRLSSLLRIAHARLGRPIVIAETGHVGLRRGSWIREISAEVRDARRSGIPVEGVCVHPVTDHRAGSGPGQSHCRGLWQLQAGADGAMQRRLDPSYAAALRAAQRSAAVL